MSKYLLSGIITPLLFTLASCGGGSSADEVVTRSRAVDQLREDEKIIWVATTGMIADALQNLGKPFSRVYGMMGPGVDPHLYKATPADLAMLEKAHFFCHNGLGLEGKFTDILADSWGYRRTYAIAAGLNINDVLKADNIDGNYDPHIWFDLKLWQKAVDSLAIVLSDLYPRLFEEIQSNSLKFQAELVITHDWATRVLGSIPTNQRVLVTAHDAFRYFGKAYNIEVMALQGVSTVAEFGIRDVTNLVDVLVERKIPAIFPETSISDKALKSVVEGCKRRDWDVILGPSLYGDALGAEGTPEATLIGAFRHNVIAIYEALSGKEYREEDWEKPKQES
jgi:manganese/zinc/iron transport system substrate-binding protein